MEITALRGISNPAYTASKPLASMSSYTEEGLEKLAKIIKAARAGLGLSLRDFGDLIGVSHSTVGRLEKAESDPSDIVLEAIATQVSQSYEELKAIAQGRVPADIRTYSSAEDVLEIARYLNESEKARLLHLLIDEISQ